jgi:trk system potassium uptake protein TrkH
VAIDTEAPAALGTRERFPKRESVIANIIGVALSIAGAGMLVCSIVEKLDGGPDAIRFVVSGLAVAVPGLALWRRTVAPSRLAVPTIFATALTAWLTLILVGTIPYLVTGVVHRFDLALFESVAGVTTTSSTVLTGLDSLGKGILLWRAMTQWLGGVSIVVFLVSVLPFLNPAGIEHLGGLTPHVGAERLAPRVRETAKRLVLLYLGFTAIVAALYRVFGMGSFDAVAHAFTTVSTGGFSTHDRSFAFFHNARIEWVAIGAMIVAGGNFALYWRALRGKSFAIVRSVEFRVYLALIASVGLVAVLSNGMKHGLSLALVRRTLFTTVSISTTTGYRLLDFDRWSGSVQLLLIFAMAIGAMAGSTGSGFRVYRLMGIVGHVRRHLFRQLHPRSVPVVRIGREIVPELVISRILGFFGLFMGIGAAATFGVAALGGLDLRTAIAAVTTTLGNVGIGLGRLGPGHTFLAVSSGARWVLMVVMLVGRLEIYPVLLGLVPLARAISDRLPPRLSQTVVRLGRG